MTRTGLSLGATALLILPLSAAWTQTPPSPAQLAEAEAHAALDRATAAQNEKAATFMGEGAPTDRAMAGFGKPALSFTTEEGETEASVAFSFDLASTEPVEETGDAAGGAKFYKLTRKKLSIVATAPIEQDSDASSLFKGDSLVNGTRLKLSYSQLSNKLGNGAGARSFIEPALEACLLRQSTIWRQKYEGTTSEVSSYVERVREYANRKEGSAPNTRGYEIALRTIGRSESADKIEGFVYTNCVPGSNGEHFGEHGALVREYTGFGDEYAALFYDERSALKFWGVDASVGKDKYQYLDSTAFEKPELSRTSWEVGAYAGLINWDSTFSVRARGVYGRTWELPDETETCETFGTPPTQHCLSGPDGQPVKNDKGLVSVEARKLVTLTDKTQIAIAPQVTYRFEDDILGVEVPVYLSPDEDGKLTGGLKFAYSSKGDDFGIGVFVGVPFSIFFE